MTSALRRRVERTLLACRETKLGFPSVFLRISGRTGRDGEVVVLHEDDATFLDASGCLDWCALTAVLDAGLGAVCSAPAGGRVRPATAYIQLQMTGVAPRGDVRAETRFMGFAHASRVRQSLASAAIRSGDALVAYGSAKCVLVDLPGDSARAPWPWLPEGFVMPPEVSVDFDAGEHEALAHCAAAEQAAARSHSFVEHFWCGVPQACEGRASLRIPVTPHLANRVGHVHGGLMLGTAAKVASAAAPEGMRLSNIAAYFISPGLGPALEVSASITHRGRRLAVVRTRIVGPAGKLVLEATSQHVAA